MGKALMIVGALGAAGAGLYATGNLPKVDMKAAMEGAVAFVEAQGDNAIYAYLFFTFIGVVALVPTTPMEFAGGFLFSTKYGMWTTWAMTSFAKLCANVVSVWCARNVLKDWVTRTLVHPSELLTMVSMAVKDEPYKMAFLVRGSMVPLCVKNYGLGVLDIGYLPIAICSCIFTPFYAFQNIYLGSMFQDLKEVFMPKKPGAEAASWLSTAKSLMPIAFNLLLVLFLFRAVKDQMKKQKERIANGLKEKEAKEESKKGK